MRNIKKAIILLLAFVFVFCFKSIGMANSQKDIELNTDKILRWEEVRVDPHITKTSDLLECYALVKGTSNTTKIRAELTLEEKTSLGWISLAGWITTEYSSNLNASYTYPRASSGKTYRLTVTADVTTNGRTETVSRSVTQSF